MLETRPSKKQRELLSFIDGFIKGNGYGPSYREVMRALDYKSVSTVATHINGLIDRGLLHKKDNSARSLEVVSPNGVSASTTPKKSSHIEWLNDEIARREKVDDDKSQQEVAILQQARDILDQPTG